MAGQRGVDGYVDHPRPAGGFVIYIVVVVLIGLALGYIAASDTQYMTYTLTFAGTLLAVLAGLDGVYLASRALYTTYCIDTTALTVRSGPLRTTIPWSKIDSFRTQWFPGTFYTSGRFANRLLAPAVQVRVRRNRVIYLTPSNVERFLAEMRAYAPQQDAASPQSVIE